MNRDQHWSADTFWTDALKQLDSIRSQGQTKITLDLEKIEAIAFDGDGPAYRLMHAMTSVERLEGEDGYRGAPRVMLALLVRLADISNDEHTS